FNAPAPPLIYTLSLHDALPIYRHVLGPAEPDPLLYDETDERFRIEVERTRSSAFLLLTVASHTASEVRYLRADQPTEEFRLIAPDRKSTRLNSSHVAISYAVFC